MSVKKKLIEVALPLEAINKESSREKSIRHGHPSTLHLWWSRKPLSTCRAVLFAQLVDDPSSHPEQFPTEEAQERDRQRLFRIIEELVRWENSTNEQVLSQARAEIRRSCGGTPPPVLDPFCGGGSIPLEAQRLGLEAHASDLNPVAVLITKALIDLPPKFTGRPPVHPCKDKRLMETEWYGACGLAEDVRYYGQWMRDEAEKRIGHLYPKVKLPKEYGSSDGTVIAWLYCRTVKCPNPACGAMMPLASRFWLSTKKGKKAWVDLGVDKQARTVHLKVKTGEPDEPLAQKIGVGTSAVNERGKKVKATFKCIVCNVGIAKGDYINIEANERRMGALPLAIVAQAGRNRIYLPFDDTQREIALGQPHQFLSDPTIRERLPTEPARGTFASNAQGRVYGFRTFADYFTLRQLVALTTFSDLVGKAQEQVLVDARKAGMADDGRGINDSGTGATAYADAVATYLGLGVSKLCDYNSSLVVWSQGRDQAKATFARQALPMVWDFGEVNPLAGAAGDLTVSLSGIAETIEKGVACTAVGATQQSDAAATIISLDQPLISTDPPSYDNVSYADLSDFFYVWLRRSLGKIYSDLFRTLLVPKAQELVATPYRFDGDREKAQQFFEEGLGKAFSHMREAQYSDYPLTVFYAFKQSETDEEDEEDEKSAQVVISTGWETMLEGLLKAGFAVTGTRPMRTERSGRSVSLGTNALASSIVLVCRPRPTDARPATRREFLAALKRELPEALRLLQHGNIAPVDLAQAAIGPGMAVFSRYTKILEADGTPMRVRTALALINQTLDEVLAEQEGEFDAGTRWALAWFEQFGMAAAPFGAAETLSKAKNTSVRGLEEAGILEAPGGKVRLLKREGLDGTWDPASDPRLTVWEVTQHLLRALEQNGEAGAAALLARVGTRGDAARDLAYRLYQICERKSRPQEALAYNSLVIAWPQIIRLAGQNAPPVQGQLL